MLFSDLAPDQEKVICQAVERVLDRAQTLGLLASPPWSLCELRLDEDDFDWLLGWAEFWTASEARHWLSRSHRFGVMLGGRETTSIAAAGALLLVVCAECARREGSEGQIWPIVRSDEDDYARFALAHDELWLESGAPRGKLYRALKEGARFLKVRRCFRGVNEQEYIGTVRLQFGFTRGGCERLAHWLCGYGWPAPVRDLVRDFQLASPSFQQLWNSMHDLRDGNLSPDAWRQKHADSAWILPDWADEIIECARAAPALRAIDDTRAGAEQITVESIAAMWEAQTPPANDDFLDLDQARFRYEGGAPFLRCPARVFRVPANAPWFDSGAATLTLHLGSTRLGTWFRVAGQRAYASPQTEWELPLTQPTLTARLVAGGETVVAKQTLHVWDASDGLGWWNLGSGRQMNVWSHAPRAQNSYALLVDGDLTIEPMPHRWQEVGERRLIFPDANWWSGARVQLQLVGKGHQQIGNFHGVSSSPGGTNTSFSTSGSAVRSELFSS